MEVRIATQASPDQVSNEDFAFAVPGFTGVLDGVSTSENLDNGCVHGTSWYVHELGKHLIRVHSERPTDSLVQYLSEAISSVRDAHQSCDLSHPRTPASTVTLLRDHEDHAEYLILCDSPLVIDQGEVTVITDERFARTVALVRRMVFTANEPISSQDHMDRVDRAIAERQRLTNQIEGYWIAAANPEAATHAVTGRLPMRGLNRLRRAALLTDGAASAVDIFALTDWSGLLNTLTEHGPQELIRQVRFAEQADSEGRNHPRYKRHDDATAILCMFEEGDT